MAERNAQAVARLDLVRTLCDLGLSVAPIRKVPDNDVSLKEVPATRARYLTSRSTPSGRASHISSAQDDTHTMRGETRTPILFVAMTTCIALAAGCQSPSEQVGSVEGTTIPWSMVPAAQSGGGAAPQPPDPPPPTDPNAGPGTPDPPTPTTPTTPGPRILVVPPVPGVTASGVHIERHDGFDRIVYDFGGTYAPRWRAQYVAEATQRGQETATRIQGRSILQIYFFDTDSAAESGIAAYNGPNPLSDPAAYSVVEVHLTPNYERGTQSFVGLRTDYPQFQVATLTEPTRIAVDIHD